MSINKPEDVGRACQVLGQPAISLWAGRLRGIAAADLGAELFEFAIVVPLLLMLLLGIVWMGRAYNVYETITRAAREGARYAVLPSSVADGDAVADPSSVQERVLDVLKADSLWPADKSTTNTFNSSYSQKTEWLENTSPQQCGVVISFTYPLEISIPFTSLNASTIYMKANAQMRLENQPTGGTCP